MASRHSRHRPVRRWWAPWREPRCACGGPHYPCPDLTREQPAPIPAEVLGLDPPAATGPAWARYPTEPRPRVRPLMTPGQEQRAPGVRRNSPPARNWPPPEPWPNMWVTPGAVPRSNGGRWS